MLGRRMHYVRKIHIRPCSATPVIDSWAISGQYCGKTNFLQPHPLTLRPYLDKIVEKIKYILHKMYVILQ
ncbi:unnamed protein product [Bursaphelenchus xylophilus]|uniref:(pine wood nematode) hypothetical protein n=1 Tax=Bursaphelenchus xylophilus TaxID=6326 RepID=A0A7I8WPD3_BURXY|nr:unnamed protein product [Bursaphelenchus xylophilus]CAG9094962.1 unnamed protein product [Bursaphelenchus xylophilus]